MGRKKHPFLAQLEARHEQEMDIQRSVTIQQCADLMMIAAADEFGFGEERLVRLHKRFEQVFREYAQLTVDDAKSDRNMEFAKEKMDRKLKQILGSHFTPWEKRYY